MSRGGMLSVMAVAALGAAGGGRASAQQPPPDSVVPIEPIEVRVLRSTIGGGNPSPVSLAVGPELTRGKPVAFLEEALRAIPGVQIQNRFNLAVGERLAVRGFGSRAQFGVRGIRVLVDGIPATLPDGQATIDHLDLAGLGRVEALRGPAGALYGNAAGGVLHFRTLDPRLVPASVGVRTTAGSHGLLTVAGTATGTAGDVGYRIGFSRLTYDGFRGDSTTAALDDTYSHAERSVLNGTLTLPTAGGTLRLVANGVDLDAQNPGSLPTVNLDAGDLRAWNNNVTNGTGKQVRQGQLGATWTGPTAGAQAEISAWGVRREFENPIPGDVIGVDRNAGGVRALLSGSSPRTDATLSWGFGFELELQRDDRREWANTGGTKGALRLDQAERVTGTGLFAQGRLDLARGVSALAGVRYDRVAFGVTDRFTVSPGDPDDSAERSMDAVTPSIGLVARAGGRWELFGSVASSFETPTTTELGNQPTGAGGFNPDLDPQRGLTFEGGVRGSFNDLWSGEITLFHTKLTDELVPFQLTADRDYYQNAGESHHTGWEVALDGRPLPGATVRVAYTRVDARFDVFTTDGGDDYSGNRVPGLAPNRVDALVILERGSGFLELRGLFQDEVPVNDSNVDGAGLPIAAESYFVADVTAGLQDLRLGEMTVSPFVGVANLFDRAYVSSVVVNAFGGRFYEPGPPRTYRVGLGVGWGR